MKLLVDLFACQTGSRYRGIGRYTQSLIREMVRIKGQHEIIALGNLLYPETFEKLRQEYIRLLPAGAFLPYYQGMGLSEAEKDAFYGVAATLVRHSYQVIAPDVILYPSVFEGWMEQGIVPLPKTGIPNSLNAAIIHDFIPYIFAEKFLEDSPNYKEYYINRLNSLKNFDLLLANSESTRQDAINILNLRPEKVITISAAASPIFKKTNYKPDYIEELFSKWGISRPYLFYTGNVEYHKNLEMALRAFSQLPKNLRTTYQFVLTHPSEDLDFKNKARSFGLEDDELVTTGYVTDDELIALYNRCKLFIFPSLYEGFGLPILEAMACGAPVIASNRSSIPEVIGRRDAMFDASSEQSMIEALYKGLSDDSFREELSLYGLERVKEFTWEKSASLAWNAIEDAIYVRQQSGQKKISVSAVKSRSRIKIAFVSPLPPQKSGIADYSAELLPYLSKFFNIDLFIEPGLNIIDPYIQIYFKLYPWTELLNRRDQYETVIYQIGNSQYHMDMVNLLKEFPGVVVLHDFYINNIFYTMEVLQGQNSAFHRHMDQSHGLRGIIDLVQNGVDCARQEWPMNWEVVRNAQELIIHSGHQINLFDRFYKGGWKPKPTIIKQLHKVCEEIPDSDKDSIRKKLGIDQNVLILCSFGMIAPTKLNLLTLQAFVESNASFNRDSLLVFVGELEGGEYGKQILKTIDAFDLNNKIRVTGYVNNDTYEEYLKITDIAIQLRVNSRGETSRALLDCMAHGIPVIINSHGTFNDYPADVVMKLLDPLTQNQLSEAMSRLCLDETYRKQLGQAARREIIEKHHPEKVAAAYAEVIYRASKTGERKLFAPLVDVLMQNDMQNDLIHTAAKNAAQNSSLRCQPRILIDVSDISGTDWKGGIQRVVKNLVMELFSIKDLFGGLELIRMVDGKLFRAFRFAEKLFNLPEGSLGDEVLITILPGDNIFMLDASWIQYDQFFPYFEKIRQHGGKIITMVYDLIPVRFPETCHQVVLDVFEKWLNAAILQSDELIGISKTVIDDVVQYIGERKISLTRALDLAYIHLGADISTTSQDGTIRDELLRMSDDSTSPLFLMIGTIEPRKGHAYTLDAFEQLWKDGKNYRLCIVGKVGWNVEQTELRIRNHHELGKNLIFFENINDAELNVCYSSATALIAASIAEGFGLPIIEAALHNVPVIASDIPVFREVGGDGARYFSRASSSDIMKLIQDMAERTSDERVAFAKKVKYLSWKESAAWLIGVLKNNQDNKDIYRMEGVQ